MCDPATIAMMTVASSVVSAGASIIGGMQQKEAADTQAQIAENSAAYEADAAKAHAEKIRKAGLAQRGEAKAALAASGVKLGEGTALEVDKSIAKNAEQDALSAILSGDRALKSGEDQASMLRASGNAAQTAGFIGAAGSVLSAGASYAKGNWKTSARAGS